VLGGRCLDVVAGEWRRVDVRIQDGRIDEVGADLPAGPGVRTLDVTGALHDGSRRRRRGLRHPRRPARGPGERSEGVLRRQSPLPDVEEAAVANRYVTAHAYTGRAIARAVRAGVRGVEHANLVDDEALSVVREHQAILTMNLVIYWALQEEGREFGLSQDNWTKVAAVLDTAHDALGRAHAAGLNPAYGTDLLGGMHRHQAQEFAIRARTIPAIDVIRGATTVRGDPAPAGG
jgi:hypothetical protein